MLELPEVLELPLPELEPDDEPDEPEPEPEPDEDDPEEEVPEPEEELPEDLGLLEVCEGLTGFAFEAGALVLADAECVEPGSRTTTTPAAAKLATETAVVAEASRFRPRSRSATARATAEGREVRNCGLLMRESVPCQLVRGVRPGSEDSMKSTAIPPNGRGECHSEAAIMTR